MSKDRNILYVPITDIIKKLQVNNVEDAINFHPINFFLSLFHIAPNRMMMEPLDEELGAVDAVWMGLMPSTIPQLINKNIKKISKGFSDKEEGLYWKEDLMPSWRQIESFNMGRAIGIHRIMSGLAGTEFKTKLIAKHNLQHIPNEAAIKKRLKAKRSSKCLQKEEDNNQRKKQKMVSKNKSNQEINCNGITCGLEKV